MTSCNSHECSNVLNNVERYESVENVTLYTPKEYADIFKSENSVGSKELWFAETVQTFMEFLSIDEKQCDINFCENCPTGK